MFKFILYTLILLVNVLLLGWVGGLTPTKIRNYNWRFALLQVH